MTALRAGDVGRYQPENTWCHEGLAVAEQRGEELVLLDTFWGASERTRVNPAVFEILFNVNDYDELDRYSHESSARWEKFAPEDRQRITSQHGLQSRWFIRKGAVEHLPTQVENARERLREAEAELRSAQRHVEWAQQELAALEAQAVPA
jgi:hypothetical protein